MQNIIVVGVTGSGKSTFAKKLSAKLNYHYIQLDLLFWKPNWQESSDEEFLEKISMEVCENANWVLDGNYDRARKVSWPLADTVIWIDLPFWLLLLSTYERAI